MLAQLDVVTIGDQPHTLPCVPLSAAQVPGYVVHRLQRVRDAGGNQAERKRRARLLALLAALIRVSNTLKPLQLCSLVFSAQ